MPAISKIRLTNIVYEDGAKRFNDETFLFNGQNAAILLENGGGKTVFIHTILQAILPHTNLGDRKIKETLQLENAPAHIGIEWITNERPRRYMTTAVSLFLHNNKLDSYRYVFEYEEGNNEALEHMPFAIAMTDDNKRPAQKEEIAEYYRLIKNKTHDAQTFDTIHAFHTYIEEQYQVIMNEWESIVKINRDEGGIEKFFENCRTTTDLYDRLLIPTVEDSIAGHEQGMFANMFEKQREGFQTYRNLQKSMEEHVAIQTELTNYVEQFKQYSDKKKSYKTTKQRAKGVAEILLEQQTAIDKEKVENDNAWKKWSEDDEELQLQTASYQIIKEQTKEQLLKKAYKEKLATYETAFERYNKSKKLLHSLRHAKYKQQLQTHEQQLTQYETELNNHDEKGEVADYEAELENEDAKLHGYYASQLEQLKKTVQNLEMEQKPLNDQIEELLVKIAKEKTTLGEEEKAVYEWNGRLIANKDRMNRLRQQLLANPDQENMQIESKKWEKRHSWLDEEKTRLIQKEKIMNEQRVKLEQEREVQRENTEKLVIKLNDHAHAEKQMQSAHTELIDKLTTVRPAWQAIDDLHLKEASVYAPLIEMQTKIEKEREDLLYKERLAHRFVDDYGKQVSFFSDPLLAEKLANWQNQFYVIEGPTFFANLDEEEREQYLNYSLWPLTLVTREADKPKLLEKVTEIKSQLQYPISIITLEEAKQLGEHSSTNNWITPTHWTTNLRLENFHRWQADLKEKAEIMTNNRVEKESEIQNMQTVIQSFEQFFSTYPQVEKDRLREERRTLQTEEEGLKRELARLKTEVEHVELEKTTLNANKQTYLDELNGLAERINKATEYFQLERETETLTKDQQEKEVKIAQIKQEIRTLDRVLATYKEDVKDIVEEKADQSQSIRIVEADTLYKEVKSSRAVYTEEVKEVIVERRENIKYKLRGIRQMYGEIKTKYDQAIKDIKRVEGEIEELIQMKATIDRNVIFPVDGDRLIDRTRMKMEEEEAAAAKLNEERLQTWESVVAQSERVKTKMERFETDFSNKPIYSFKIELDEMEQFLKTTNIKLTERETYLYGQTDRITKELANIKEASQALEKFAVAHHFKSTVIKTIPLSESEITELTYNRMITVEQVTNQLQVKHAASETAKEKIERVKQSFRTFCRNHITEMKLREMAMTGIEIKTTYEDVLQFQENMVTTVERADQYALEFISEKDKEVQAFINSIHNHLRNVTEQMRMIPRNTRVKVGDQSREIFKFTIPEWSEEDGKGRIRNHMDWILEQLEASHFKDDEGQEDSGKVRKQVETWLQTKSLLQVVLDNEGMKVSCRKVTNDNQVTSRLTSWEQSNQWSGGEKWSKNMTLFLGILNFVAEKKQHVTKTTKRNRAVILDNPFGKASSDHVLSPVFFIAEQLGFQIIAFTAHADGKFLQDYFPIIYSLKLRTTEDESRQVMTKEKSLHHAYFEDHEPAELKRLEEREQMELF